MGNGRSVLSKPRCCLELTIATEFVSVFLIHLNSENNVFCVCGGLVNTKMGGGRHSTQKDRKSVFSLRTGCVEGPGLTQLSRFTATPSSAPRASTHTTHSTSPAPASPASGGLHQVDEMKLQGRPRAKQGLCSPFSRCVCSVLSKPR